MGSQELPLWELGVPLGTLDTDSWTGFPSGDNFCPSQGAASFAPEPPPQTLGWNGCAGTPSREGCSCARVVTEGPHSC